MLAASRVVLAGFALVVVLGLPGAAAAPRVTARSTPASCISPPVAAPGGGASLGDEQNGKTFCVAVGTKLLVSLSAPMPKALLWHHIKASPAGILSVAPMSSILSRNVTATRFTAARSGVATLSSERRACSPTLSSSLACRPYLYWKVTVIVRRS
jgi:hypothetical protein